MQCDCMSLCAVCFYAYLYLFHCTDMLTYLRRADRSESLIISLCESARRTLDIMMRRNTASDGQTSVRANQAKASDPPGRADS